MLLFSLGATALCIVLLLSLRSPLIGLIAWVIFLPVQIDTLAHLGFRLAISDIFLPFAALPLFITGKVRLPTRLMLHIILLIGCFIIATGIAVVRTGILQRYTLINKDIGLLILLFSLFLIISLLRSKDEIYRIIKWLVYSAFVINTISLIGYIAELLWRIPTPFLVLESRLVGLLVDPNAYGGYLVPIFLLQISLLIAKKKFFFPWFMRLNALLLLLGIILTSSRSAWVGLVLGTIILLWFYKLRFGIRASGSLLGAIVLIYLVFGPAFMNEMITIASRKIQIITRWELIQLGLSNFMSNPLLGIGLGVFPSLSGGAIIHNTYVWVLVEMGVLGFIVLMSLVYHGARNYWVSIKGLPKDRALTIGLFAGYIGMLGVAIGIEAFYQRYFWLLLALSEVLYRVAKKEKQVG